MDIKWLKKYKGKNHSKWNGGRIVTPFGYILKYSPSHPHKNKMGKGYVLEHRLVMEKKIGRYLKKKEVIHHINGIKDDNRIENLVLTTKSEHVAHHKHLEGCSDEARKKHKKNFENFEIDSKTGLIIRKIKH